MYNNELDLEKLDDITTILTSIHTRTVRDNTVLTANLSNTYNLNMDDNSIYMNYIDANTKKETPLFTMNKTHDGLFIFVLHCVVTGYKHLMHYIFSHMESTIKINSVYELRAICERVYKW